jgi:hypothetical protein
LYLAYIIAKPTRQWKCCISHFHQQGTDFTAFVLPARALSENFAPIFLSSKEMFAMVNREAKMGRVKIVAPKAAERHPTPNWVYCGTTLSAFTVAVILMSLESRSLSEAETKKLFPRHKETEIDSETVRKLEKAVNTQFQLTSYDDAIEKVIKKISEDGPENSGSEDDSDRLIRVLQIANVPGALAELQTGLREVSVKIREIMHDFAGKLTEQGARQGVAPARRRPTLK